MAPERFFGTFANVQTDIYELALVLYVMLVGRLPWDIDDPRGRLTPKEPAAFGVAIPPLLTATLMLSLSTDVERRPASATALLEAVERAASDPISPISQEARHSAAHAPTELVAITPPAFDARTARSPGAPNTPQGPHTPIVAVVGASVPPAAAVEPRKSSGVGLLAAGALIALIAAGAGAVATGALPFGRSPNKNEKTVTDPSSTADDDPKDAVAPAPSQSSSASSTASATAAPSASMAPSASASAAPQSIPSASAAPPVPTTSGSSNASGVTSGSASSAAPPACTALIALMCSPTSGARPEECTAWKDNVARWRASLPPNVVADTCQSALSTSQKGLALRKGTRGP
jgi:serine/threonine-protein kinase